MSKTLVNYPHDPNTDLPAPPNRRAEGVAIAALVLTIIGLLFSWIPLLNWLFAAVAAVGVALGVGGLLASTRKVMSGIAVGLGVLAMAIVIGVTASLGTAVDKASEPGRLNAGTASAPGTTGAPVKGDDPNATKTWGGTYTWGNGVAITVEAPKPCTPTRSGDGRMIKVTTTVTNGSQESLTTALLAFGDAQFDGVATTSKFQFDGDCKADNLNSTTVLPGNTFTFTTTYGVGDQPGTLQLVYQAGLFDDKAIFVGQV